MNILVTGGAGFIGSHMVLELFKKGYNPIILDLKDITNEYLKQFKSYKGSYGDVEILGEIFKKEKIDLVAHFGGWISVPESVDFPWKYWKNNTYNTGILIETMKKFKINKLIFSSTAATYGTPKQNPISEMAIQEPINPYGTSKLDAEKLIINSGLEYIIFRYFNVAGANAELKVGYTLFPAPHIIPAINNVTTGRIKKDFTINGDDYNTLDGTNVRDYVHVSDLVDAHILGVEYLANNLSSDIFNLGSGSGYSNKEIFDQAEKVLNIKIPHKYGPRRQGDPDELKTDNSKVKKILLWEPKKDLSVMIKSDYDWQKKEGLK